jgi:hypothetical protein
MIDELAKAMDRRPPIRVTVPVLTPRLSSLWVGLVTPVDTGVARPLIEGLSHETVVEDPSGMAALPARERIPLDLALREAVAEMDEDGYNPAKAASRAASSPRNGTRTS